MLVLGFFSFRIHRNSIGEEILIRDITSSEIKAFILVHTEFYFEIYIWGKAKKK